MVEGAEYSESSKLSPVRIAISQEPVLEKHLERWFAVDKIFWEGWKPVKTCYDVDVLVCVTRDPGVGTAETNRIIEQALLNLKALFSFHFFNLCATCSSLVS